MERRVLIAVFLSFLVLYGYQSIFVPPAPEQPAGTTTPAAQQPAAVSAPAAAPSAAAPAAPVADATPAPAAVIGDAAEREIVVETATVRAVLSNRGARVMHWHLKEYLDASGQPVDLVPSEVPADQAVS